MHLNTKDEHGFSHRPAPFLATSVRNDVREPDLGTPRAVRVISPVIPPQGALQELVHGPALRPTVRPATDPDLRFAISIVGEGGRVVSRHLFVALNWEPAQRLRLQVDESGSLTVIPDSDGARRLKRKTAPDAGTGLSGSEFA
ncbi:hypothetical protein [Nocardia nova]|uniref:hypothetical protein n=1 Tax=Nocardia nova TaxID=37330 RepID=UPI0033CCB797